MINRKLLAVQAENGCQGTSRGILMSVFVLILSLLVQASISSALPPQVTRIINKKVVVVGAGVSGVAAANKLIRGGLKDVTILEAQHRYGGRVYYKKLGGDLGGVDLGGHWIHGEAGNVVFDLASGINFTQHSGDYTNLIILREDGSQIFLTESLEQLYKNIFKAKEEASRNQTDATYRELIYNQVEQFGKLQDLSEKDIEGLSQYAAHFMCILEGCEDISQVSLKCTDQFQEIPGDHLVEWSEGGMSNILDLLMGTHEKSPWKGLGVDSKVLLNSRVSKIDWSSSNDVNAVTVTTESGSQIKADFVIFTPSINFLKKNHEKIFKPALPLTKIEALEALEMDVVDKVYLVYSKPWWPNNESFSFIPLHLADFTSESQDLSEAVVEISTEHHNPKVLGAWFIGKGAKKMENMTDEEVKCSIMKLLKERLGKSFTITEPDMIVRSGWWNTQDVIGSYSFNSVKGDHFHNPRGILSQPLLDLGGKPVVLFAGEATNQIHYSTVHGALETGWREAQRILDYLKM